MAPGQSGMVWEGMGGEEEEAGSRKVTVVVETNLAEKPNFDHREV